MIDNLITNTMLGRKSIRKYTDQMPTDEMGFRQRIPRPGRGTL